MVETFLGHGAVIVYIVVVTIAGYREGFDPAFTIVPGLQRNSLHLLRLLPGIVMLNASIDWLAGDTALLRWSNSASEVFELERTA
ncbi:MAG: hypothetical protein WCF30_20655 [Terracidiphilus sp.]